MKRVPATGWPFALILLLLLCVAKLGGAWATIEQTLRADTLRAEAEATRAQAAQIEAQQRARASEPKAPPAPAPNRLFDEAWLVDAREQLLALPQFEGQPLKVFDDIHFYDDGRINLEVVDPLQPGNVDEYGFDEGVWTRGKPVNPNRMAPLITLERNSAPLADVDFAVVARIASALREHRARLQVEPEEVSHVYVVVRRGKLRWLPEDVHGDRESVELRYDAGGNVTAVRRH